MAWPTFFRGAGGLVLRGWHSLGSRLELFVAGAVVTAGVTVLYLARPAWVEFQENKLYDMLLAFDRPIVRSNLPLVVDIDEASLAEHGQWPWPRYRVALLLGRLRNAGVAAVGLDIVFAEPDRASPSAITRQLHRDLKLEVTVTGLPAALTDYDQVLADMLRTGPFSLGFYQAFAASGNGDAPAEAKPCPLPPPRLSLALSPDARAPDACLPRSTRTVCPLPVLAKAAPAAGFINTLADRDNILRRSPLLLLDQDRLTPSLALATVMEAYGVKTAVLRLTAGGVESLTLSSERLGRRVIPLDASGRVLINYRGPGGSFPRVSAADVLAGRIDAEDLRGRIVFVGTSAAALRDLQASPLDRSMPGVEVHATIADMIAADDFLSQPDWAPAVELAALAATGLLSAGLLGFAPAAVLLLPFAALAAGVLWGSASLLAHARLAVSPLFPLLVLALNFAILTFLKFWREERQKRFLHGAFSRYVAPAVVAKIMAKPGAFNLSGEEKDVTVLFSDVRGFTSLSEHLSPTQLSELLHRYFTPMTHIIVSRLGTLDKFIGDAIMAFWNAPLAVPGHPALAVRAALEMTAGLKKLNEEFKRDFGFAIACGIGLHRGCVRVGNFGSEDLFDYTVIGDVVNLTSRLEGLTKYYGVRILATDSLRREAGAEAAFEEVDLVRVKGREVPVTLYAVLSQEERLSRTEELDAAAVARDDYKNRRFTAAAAAYADLAKRFPCRLYAIFADRAAALAQTPPPEDWDGVFEHTTK